MAGSARQTETARPGQGAEGVAGPAVRLTATTADRAAALLIALLILVAVAVLLLLIIWYTRQTLVLQHLAPLELVENAEGRGDHAVGTARDLEPPGVEELVEFQEPQLEQTLEAVTNSVSSQLATLEELTGEQDLLGHGSGQGDSRQAGELGEGDGTIPRAERWEVRFSSSSLGTYARQLDYFQIELGAVGGGRAEVDYARQLAQPEPAVRSGPGDAEKRLYMTWRTGGLRQADRDLLAKAGIATAGRVTMQFYPPEVEQTLASLEMNYAGGRPIKEIAKTVFEVKDLGDGYQFFVTEQKYR